MKIDSQTIIDSARRQREHDQNGITPKPWRRRRFSAPTWLVALPAAAVAGFLFGLFVRQPESAGQSFTAKADTVFITREVPVAQRPDTVIRYVERPRRHHHRVAESVADRSMAVTATGRSMAEDNIDYSLLVLQ